jgi:RHS repeat-associated protein
VAHSRCRRQVLRRSHRSSESREENRALARVVRGYDTAVADSGARDSLAAPTDFLAAHPRSVWKPALLVNPGSIYRQTGQFSAALESWRSAWELTKRAVDANGGVVGMPLSANCRSGCFVIPKTAAPARGLSISKPYFEQGFVAQQQGYYYVADQLGSVRQLIDSAGRRRAQYDYDPYGHMTKTRGDLDSDHGYAGYFQHAATGLAFAMLRAYDSGGGRWLNPDPIGENAGLNRYAGDLSRRRRQTKSQSQRSSTLAEHAQGQLGWAQSALPREVRAATGWTTGDHRRQRVRCEVVARSCRAIWRGADSVSDHFGRLAAHPASQSRSGAVTYDDSSTRRFSDSRSPYRSARHTQLRVPV